MPVVVEPFSESFRERRLKLPRPQISHRVIAGIQIDERVFRPVAKSGGLGQARDIEIRERGPRNLTGINRDFIKQLRRVPPEKVKLLERGHTKKLGDARFSERAIP